MLLPQETSSKKEVGFSTVLMRTTLLRLINALRSTLSLGLVMDRKGHHDKPMKDEYAIDTKYLEVYEDRQIGSGAFAKVFLGELRGPKRKSGHGSSHRTAESTTKVAVKQALLATEESR